MRWHRQWLRRRWTERSRQKRPGRSRTDAAIRTLIYKMIVAAGSRPLRRSRLSVLPCTIHGGAYSDVRSSRGACSIGSALFRPETSSIPITCLGVQGRCFELHSPARVARPPPEHNAHHTLMRRTTSRRVPSVKGFCPLQQLEVCEGVSAPSAPRRGGAQASSKPPYRGLVAQSIRARRVRGAHEDKPGRGRKSKSVTTLRRT